MAYPWAAHDILTAADLNAAFATAVVSTGLGAYTAYTPAWSGTIGNGSLAGAYWKSGRKVEFRAAVTWGSTTTHPASAQTLSIPVACVAAAVAFPAGSARILDSSASGLFARQAYLASTTTLAFLAEAGSFVTNALPMTWATGDTLLVAGYYEAAS